MAVSHAMHWLLLSVLISSAAGKGLARNGAILLQPCADLPRGKCCTCPLSPHLAAGTSYANAEQALDAFLDGDGDFNDVSGWPPEALSALCLRPLAPCCCSTPFLTSS